MTAPAIRPRAAESAAEALTEDGALAILLDPRARALAEPWLPRIARPAAVDVSAAEALLRVEVGSPTVVAPAAPPAMEMWDVGGWLGEGDLVLADSRGRVGGRVELAARRGTVRLAAGRGDDPPIADVSAALTMAAALLLGRLGRALVHGGAVLTPSGGAWLLAGGSFSGKTTTCVTLIRGGWDWLSDDHVVLSPGAEGRIAAEAWPRRFNLDHGYAHGASQGLRSRVDPEGFGPGRWRRAAPLAGLLFPRVQAELPTAVAPVRPAAALSELLRNAPWLLADAGAAPVLLGLLTAAAALPAYELRLGGDTYCNAQALQSVLGSAGIASR